MALLHSDDLHAILLPLDDVYLQFLSLIMQFTSPLLEAMMLNLQRSYSETHDVGDRLLDTVLPNQICPVLLYLELVLDMLFPKFVHYTYRFRILALRMFLAGAVHSQVHNYFRLVCVFYFTPGAISLQDFSKLNLLRPLLSLSPQHLVNLL